MSHFYINTRTNNDLTILDLNGKLGIGFSSVYLGDTLRRLLDNGQKQIILNFSKVFYIDGVGSGELIKGFNTTAGAGGNLKISGLNTEVLELMIIVKLSTVFEFFENEKTAADSFRIRRNNIGRNHSYKNPVSNEQAAEEKAAIPLLPVFVYSV